MVHPIGADIEGPFREGAHLKLTPEQKEFLTSAISLIELEESRTGVAPQQIAHNLQQFKKGIETILNGKFLDPAIRRELESAALHLDEAIHVAESKLTLDQMWKKMNAYFQSAQSDIKKAVEG